HTHTHTQVARRTRSPCIRPAASCPPPTLLYARVPSTAPSAPALSPARGPPQPASPPSRVESSRRCARPPARRARQVARTAGRPQAAESPPSQPVVLCLAQAHGALQPTRRDRQIARIARSPNPPDLRHRAAHVLPSAVRVPGSPGAQREARRRRGGGGGDQGVLGLGKPRSAWVCGSPDVNISGARRARRSPEPRSGPSAR
ncbi:hypothetical protein CERSUDRAFT_120363, partial [Gelatoporia subvermispora B]